MDNFIMSVLLMTCVSVYQVYFLLLAQTRTPQPKPAPGFGEFVPRADAFLKEHLFADIFASDVLTCEQREVASISVLAAMPVV